MSESVFEGRLTESEYQRWFKCYRASPDLAVLGIEFSAIQEHRARREFCILRESELILDNFFNLDEAFRRSVESFAGNECSAIHIEEFVTLALEVQSLELEFSSDEQASIGRVGFVLHELLLRGADSGDVRVFDAVLHEYVMTRERDESLLLVENIVVMLAILRGASLVLDVLQRWELGAYPGEPEDFVAVVRDWENLKMYPIEWAVNVVRSSREDD